MMVRPTPPARLRSHPASRRAGRPPAFTLVELLVVIAIMGVLLGLLLPALGRAKGAARIATQLSSASQLLTGYELYAQEHQGFVLPAIVEPNRGPMAIRKRPVNHMGEPVQGEPARRYFWRLASYLDFNFDVMYRDRALLERYLEAGDFYAITLFTGFGINQRYIGGLPDYYPADDESSTLYIDTWGRDFWISRIDQADRPSDLFTFVSTAYDIGGFFDGYFRAIAPNFTAPLWPDVGLPTRPDASPGKTGNVWPVDGVTCVVGMLDGHAEARHWEQMRDMRNWAPKADAPDWRLSFP